MAEIDLTPTEEMAANAARGLELRRKHGKGGTEIGVARARDISNRKNLSPETVRRMHAFFSRHEKNKAGGEDDAGYIAWMLWSGDAGRDWAKRKVEQMDKGENERSDTYKEIAQRLGSAAKHDRPGAKAKFSAAQGWISGTQLGREFGREIADELGRGVTSLNDNDIDNGLEMLARAYEKEGHNMVTINKAIRGWMSYKQAAKLGQVRASRPGAKATMGASRLYVLAYEGRTPHRIPVQSISEGIEILKQNPSAAASLIHESDIGKRTTIAYGTKTGRANWTEAGIEVSRKMSRPGAKAKMGNAEDVRSLLAQAEQMIWTAKRPEQKREVMELVKDAERMIDASMPSGFRMRLDRLKQRIASEFSRPGAKAKMAKYRIGAHVAIDYKGETVKGRIDSLVSPAPETYTVSIPSKSVRVKRTLEEIKQHFPTQDWVGQPMSRPGAKAKFGYEKSINIMLEDARIPDHVYDWHNGVLLVDAAYHDRIVAVLKSYVPWEIKSLPKIQKVEMSRPGAKAKFAFKVGDRVHAGFGVAGGAGVIGTITKIEDGYAHIQGDASALDRYGPKTYKARLDRLTAPPKKAWESSKNAIREGEKVSASDDAVSRKIRKLMDEGKPQKQAVAIALDLERRGEL